LTSVRKIKKLKNKIHIDDVFKKGKQLRSDLLVLRYLKDIEVKEAIFIGVAVSKRDVFLAVERNRVKRQIRASVQLYKKLIEEKLPCGYYMFLYKGKLDHSSEELSKTVAKLLDSLGQNT
tara:strand:- start:801 stop:1160 length:360 start_codon:yes stop_codon:yes gene_type:complete